MTNEKNNNPLRAASAYKLAYDIEVWAQTLTAEFPAIASQLRIAARLANTEAKKAEK
jgi:hypothetical protein